MLLIVARDRQSLYDYFKWGLAGTAGVDVVLDRRVWTRRNGSLAEASDLEQRRGRDRRQRPGMRGELTARGFVIAR